jgi:Short C-terminal domain
MPVTRAHGARAEPRPHGSPAGSGGNPAGNSRSRKTAIAVLVAIGSLMLGVAVLATWVDKVFLDSGTWADTSTAALQQPAVRTALSEYVVDQVYANVDVPAQLARVLPVQARGLAGPVAVAGEPYAQRAIAAGLARPRVVALWRNANLRAHAQLMRILDGGSGPLTTGNGEVALDLRPLVNQLASSLAEHTNRSVTLPPDAGRFVLLQSNQLRLAQDGTKLLRTIALPLGLLALAVFAVAVYISRARRRTLRAVAFGMLTAGLVLVVVRRVIGDTVVQSLTPVPDVRAAGHVAWYLATQRLSAANVTLCTCALLLLLGTWFAGPGRRATHVRRLTTPYLRDPALAFGAYGLVLLLLIVWAPVPATRDPVMILILGVLGAIGIEALRRLVAREFPEAVERDLGEHVDAGLRSAYHGVRHARPPEAAADARYSSLERLASLHDRGTISDEEFATEKASLLAPR